MKLLCTRSLLHSVSECVYNRLHVDILLIGYDNHLLDVII
jgi:hypothetical protein